MILIDFVVIVLFSLKLWLCLLGLCFFQVSCDNIPWSMPNKLDVLKAEFIYFLLEINPRLNLMILKRPKEVYFLHVVLVIGKCKEQLWFNLWVVRLGGGARVSKGWSHHMLGHYSFVFVEAAWEKVNKQIFKSSEKRKLFVRCSFANRMYHFIKWRKLKMSVFDPCSLPLLCRYKHMHEEPTLKSSFQH